MVFSRRFFIGMVVFSLICRWNGCFSVDFSKEHTFGSGMGWGREGVGSPDNEILGDQSDETTQGVSRERLEICSKMKRKMLSANWGSSPPVCEQRVAFI